MYIIEFIIISYIKLGFCLKQSLRSSDMSSKEIFSEENIKKNVLPLFNILGGQVSQIKFKNTEKQRAVYKVIYYDKVYCLKKVYYSKEDLLFIYSALEWLYRNSISVPRLLSSLDKKRYVTCENMLFVLTDWLQGEKCDYDNVEHIIKCSRTLGKMHKVSKNFIPIHGSSLREGYGNIYTSYNKHFNDLLSVYNKSQKYNDKFSKIYADNFNDNFILSRRAVEIASLVDHSKLTKSLCHMDYVNKNILIDGDTVSIIDFDKCRMDFAAHDISYFLRRILKRNNSKWSFELAVSSINLYSEENNLNLNDYLYIISYLSFPQKYWKISRDYYKNRDKCNKDSFINLLKDAASRDDLQINFMNDFIKYIENKFKTKIPG